MLVIIVAILIIIDQASKILVTTFVYEPIETYMFGIEVTHNTGMAFGFNSGNTKNIVLTIFVLAVVFSFIKNQIERIDAKTTWALSLLLAGALSNLIDRFFRGGILDFIRIYNFPIFNLADIFIVVGVILLIVFLIDFTKKDIEV
jgi:signal peptidase II